MCSYILQALIKLKLTVILQQRKNRPSLITKSMQSSNNHTSNTQQTVKHLPQPYQLEETVKQFSLGYQRLKQQNDVLKGQESIYKLQMLQRINDQLVREIQNNQQVFQTKIQSMHLNFADSLSKYRIANTTQMESYVQQLSIYQQQIILLEKKVKALKKQSQSKDMKLQSLQKAITCYLARQQSTKKRQTEIIVQSTSEQVLKSKSMPETNSITQLIQKIYSIQTRLIAQQQKNKELTTELQKNRSQIKSLTHQSLLQTKQNDSLQIQLKFYKESTEQKTNQIKHLQSMIKKLNQQQNTLKIQHQNQINQLSKNMKNQIEYYKQMIARCQEQMMKKDEDIRMYRVKFREEEGNIGKYVEKIKWYEEVISQAKANFVYNELKNQQQINNLKKLNNELKKQVMKAKGMENSEASIVDYHHFSRSSSQRQSNLRIKMGNNSINLKDHSKKYIRETVQPVQVSSGKENNKMHSNLQIKTKKSQGKSIRPSQIMYTKSARNLDIKNYHSTNIPQKMLPAHHHKLSQNKLTTPQSLNSSQHDYQQDQSFVTEYEITNFDKFHNDKNSQIEHFHPQKLLNSQNQLNYKDNKEVNRIQTNNKKIRNQPLNQKRVI